MSAAATADTPVAMKPNFGKFTKEQKEFLAPYILRLRTRVETVPEDASANKKWIIDHVYPALVEKFNIHQDSYNMDSVKSVCFQLLLP